MPPDRRRRVLIGCLLAVIAAGTVFGPGCRSSVEQAATVAPQSFTRQSDGDKPLEGALEGTAPGPEAQAGDPRAGATMLTWRDGDRTRTVWQAPADKVAVRGQASGQAGSQTDGEVGGQASGQGGEELVFYDESGQRMSLPGGVVMVFDPGWSTARIDALLAGQGIARNRIETRGFTVNAYFVQTPAGLASLDLANQLAALDGVLISSPNWRFEAVAR